MRTNKTTAMPNEANKSDSTLRTLPMVEHHLADIPGVCYWWIIPTELRERIIRFAIKTSFDAAETALTAQTVVSVRPDAPVRHPDALTLDVVSVAPSDTRTTIANAPPTTTPTATLKRTTIALLTISRAFNKSHTLHRKFLQTALSEASTALTLKLNAADTARKLYLSPTNRPKRPGSHKWLRRQMPGPWVAECKALVEKIEYLERGIEWLAWLEVGTSPELEKIRGKLGLRTGEYWTERFHYGKRAREARRRLRACLR